jgi:hypothetical protein
LPCGGERASRKPGTASAARAGCRSLRPAFARSSRTWPPWSPPTRPNDRPSAPVASPPTGFEVPTGVPFRDRTATPNLHAWRMSLGRRTPQKPQAPQKPHRRCRSRGIRSTSPHRQTYIARARRSATSLTSSDAVKVERHAHAGGVELGCAADQEHRAGRGGHPRRVDDLGLGRRFLRRPSRAPIGANSGRWRSERPAASHNPAPHEPKASQPAALVVLAARGGEPERPGAIRTPGRLPRLPAPLRTYETSAGGLNGRSGHVLNNQRRRLVGVVVADAEHP